MNARLAAVSIFLLPFCTTAWCQIVTGSIRGVITGIDGQPLPGAIVTTSSAALIGKTRTTTTSEQGIFRFPSLPIGFYSVEARIEGFQIVRAERVEVTLGGTANVPLTMRMAYGGVSISVVGETPLIDVRNSGMSTIYKEEMLENVPSRRNMWFLMQVAPGMSVDHTGLGDSSIIAFGSNRQSNSWHIDGIDVTAPETGRAWWYTNPDIIEQIQVHGVGAPAEYGNHTGAVLNVVTKKGSNTLHGGSNYFFQTDALTDVNVRLPDSDFLFHRDKYYDLTAQIGGPITTDRVWFFGAVETLRDAYTTGSDPANVPVNKNDRYDLKVTARLGENHELSSFVHDEEYDYNDAPSPYISDSALGHEFGTNPAWGAILTSTWSRNLLVELRYAGWWNRSYYGSQTGSLEEPHTDYNVSPEFTSGGLYYPWEYVTYRHQVNGKATYYADRFLKSQHEFKFGAQYSYGSADTMFGLGSDGFYTYSYGNHLYKVEQIPFHYGAVSQDLGVFVDDTVAVNDRLTLNVGVRFDHNKGSFPEYDRLGVGTPSITRVGNWRSTGQSIPGIEDFIQWNLVSPRLGFVWQTRKDGRAALRGSFGVYYDHNVSGNWDSPPPESPPIQTSVFFPDTGQYGLVWESTTANVSPNPNINPPRCLQYLLGYEYQPTENSSIGIQYVYKDTKDLVGWQILGGLYEPLLITDPFTGREYPFLNPIENAILQKGNDPGDFPGSEGLRYFQTYQGVILTFARRFSDDWAVNASYTWSKSYGLIPRMFSQQQSHPFYGNREGSDPNNYLNATGRLQGDRPHMFRAQVLFFKLPWDLQAAASLEFASGRSHNRQMRVCGYSNSHCIVIMEPGGSYRYQGIQNIDLSIGKRIPIGDRFQFRIDGQILNLLNSDQELAYATLVLQDPSETFVPSAWVEPRRLQLRVGFQF